MRKALKLLGFLSATLVLFFVVASLAFYHLVRIGEVRRFLVDEIEKQTELKIDLGGADLEIGWITGVVFRNVSVRERDESSPALTAERVTARVALRPLLRRQIIFYEIHLTRPTAHLVRDSAGHIISLAGRVSTVSAVPEPAAESLVLAMMLAGLLLWRRYRAASFSRSESGDRATGPVIELSRFSVK